MTESMYMRVNYLLYLVSLEEYLKTSTARGEPPEGIIETIKWAVSTQRSVLEAVAELKTLSKSQVN